MTRTELAILVAACAVWALHFVVAKAAVEMAPPLFYAAMRMGLLTLVLAPLLRIHRGRMGYIILAGLCLGALNFGLFFTGVTQASPSAAAIATQLGAPFATLLSVMILGERVGWRRTIGIAAAFTGVALIAFNPNDFSMDLGVVLVASSVLVEAFGAIIVRKLADIRPLELQAWFGVVGFGVLIVLSAFFEDGQIQAIQDGGVQLGLAVCYSALLASLFSFTTYYWLLQKHGVSQIAPLTLITPVMAVGFGVTLMGDVVTLVMAIGAALTIFGVGVVLVRSGAGRGAARNDARLDTVEGAKPGGRHDH